MRHMLIVCGLCETHDHCAWGARGRAAKSWQMVTSPGEETAATGERSRLQREDCAWAIGNARSVCCAGEERGRVWPPGADGR